ncbi:MAG: alternative ribosome rescue aminoacyl-tRNA hydrolase ArfB [Pirellulales bacterium]
MSDLVIRHDLLIPAEQIEMTYARSGGPGGQNVNKVNSKAVLRWKIPEDFLPPAPLNRFRKAAARFLTVDGDIVIQSDEYRDQARNAERCRDKLRILIVEALVPPKRRIATKPTKASKRRRVEDKRRDSEKKQSRRNLD